MDDTTRSQRLAYLMTKQELGTISHDEHEELHDLINRHNIALLKGKNVLIAPTWIMDLLITMN